MNEQAPTPPQPPQSPCIHVCLLDAARQCIGCHRTREEIAGWLSFRDDEKRAILDQLPARRRG